MLLKKVRSSTLILLAVGALASAFLQLHGDVNAQASPTPVQNGASKGGASNGTAMMVQDFEKPSSPPTVWVVNIPDDHASVQLSTDHPHDGKQCLKLHYHFLGAGNFQYLGIPNKTNIQVPAHKLHFRLRGDNSKCSYGVQLIDVSGETHQYGKNTGQCGLIDFAGWKEIVVDMDAPHETWGGDKNGKADYPLTGITLTVGQPTDQARLLSAQGNLYFDALRVDSEKGTGETVGRRVAVLSPDYCSDVKGNTLVKLAAPGSKQVTVKCWKGGRGFGADSTVATVALDAKGSGSFIFPADAYPHGPITVRISGDMDVVKDTCYLQLYNRGGVAWSEGIPERPPRAAKGMTLVFADDFKGPLSISSTDPRATYYDHKPPNGYQDFSVHVFSGHGSPQGPFAQVDSFLRIRASDKTHSSGLISSLKNNATGVKVSAPCYFECRFIGPNAVGAWPGFWLMTDYMTGYDKLKDKTPCDELDIIEAYGGEGPGSPNADDTYMVTPHCWNQGEAGKAIETKAFEGLHNPIRMRKFGIPSTWFETFHTYGCKITATDTIYFCDDIEVGRHSTLPLSRKQPLFYMVNLATGGGWPVDLSRYNGLADMYVDYVRVYHQAP
jgi:Glycosyl hydrolases family 16